LQPLHRLGEELNVSLWIKRDDLTGDILSGGNKVRKLEYLLNDARKKGADTVLAAGGVQSNLAKTVAALSIRLGLRPLLVLMGKEPEYAKGNLFLNRVMGVEIRFVEASHPSVLESEMMRLAEEERGRGNKPYIIPFGGSNGMGALGYLEAYRELTGQKEDLNIDFDWEFVSAGSGATLAGICLGHSARQSSSRLVGISPWLREEEVRERVNKCIKEAGPLLPDKLPAETQPVIEDRYIGEGYSIPTQEGAAAIRTVAGMEGLMLDQTYTGKTMAGLFDYVARGLIKPGQSVLFWHTGGAPGLFALNESGNELFTL